MKKAILFSAILLQSFFSFAGDNGGGAMECVSASGRTKISATGVAEYNGFGPLAVKITIDNKSIDLGQEQKNTSPQVTAYGVTVFNPKLKVYTAVVSLIGQAGQYEYSVKAFELVAIPSSFRQLPSEQFLFDAVLNTVDPRELQTEYPVMVEGQIQVRCRMDQSI